MQLSFFGIFGSLGVYQGLKYSKDNIDKLIGRHKIGIFQLMRCKRLLLTKTSTECRKGQMMTILVKWNRIIISYISWTQWYKIQDMMILLMRNDQSPRHDTKWIIEIMHWIHEGVYNIQNVNTVVVFGDPLSHVGGLRIHPQC